ncbi:MAG: beta-lactamase family protein [Gemmatimonadetes bacterium]|nr:beta-lactamase family protein [Gemmatimonadota bacterium]
MKDEMTRQQLVGLSLAVFKDGKLVLERGYGFANLEHQVPATPATVYQSGSVGKQFTAAGIMLLVRDGKLRLDEPVTQVFPSAPAEFQQVTIEHLLTHTGGTGDYPDNFDLRHDWTEDELKSFIFSRPLRFPPGSKWEYSNMGYVLLGLIIHEVSGQFYGDFLAERIFRPLGMSTTRIINEAAIIPNRAAGYERDSAGTVENQAWVAPRINTTADGSLYFTVRDLARWDLGLRNGALFTPAELAHPHPMRLRDRPVHRLRLRLVGGGGGRPPRHGARRLVAGLQDAHPALPGGWAHGGGAGQRGVGGAGRRGARGGQAVEPRAGHVGGRGVATQGPSAARARMGKRERPPSSRKAAVLFPARIVGAAQGPRRRCG